MNTSEVPFRKVTVPGTSKEEEAAFVEGYAVGTQDERTRVLKLMERVVARLVANKGKGWRAELETLAAEIYKGTQSLDGIEH